MSSSDLQGSRGSDVKPAVCVTSTLGTGGNGIRIKHQVKQGRVKHGSIFYVVELEDVASKTHMTTSWWFI